MYYHKKEKKICGFCVLWLKQGNTVQKHQTHWLVSWFVQLFIEIHSLIDWLTDWFTFPLQRHSNASQSLCEIIRLSRDQMFQVQGCSEPDPLLATLEKYVPPSRTKSPTSPSATFCVVSSLLYRCIGHSILSCIITMQCRVFLICFLVKGFTIVPKSCCKIIQLLFCLLGLLGYAFLMYLLF